jgi:hypothetical protein
MQPFGRAAVRAAATLVAMTVPDVKADLLEYLQGARGTLLWKLDGLSEYDIRRPLTPTGTNLLGLVKHQAGGELRYFGGPVFGEPHGERLPWLADGAALNADMWATPQETREAVAGLYRRAWRHADATITRLPLEATAVVPWWGGASVTLGHILVHVTAETQRHAGHADIVRELIDGSAGLLPAHSNLPPGDTDWWRGYRDQVDQAARDAAPVG